MQPKEGDIQFYHFKHKYIDRDGNKLIPAIEQLAEELNTSGEHIDALVLPCGVSESQATLRWLEGAKKRWPGMKVLVTDATISGTAPDDLPYRFAIAKSPKDRITNLVTKAVILPDNEKYALAPGIDCVTAGLSGAEDANVLREMLGLPKLSAVSLRR